MLLTWIPCVLKTLHKEINPFDIAKHTACSINQQKKAIIIFNIFTKYYYLLKFAGNLKHLDLHYDLATAAMRLSERDRRRIPRDLSVEMMDERP